jgi:hypothetical protein
VAVSELLRRGWTKGLIEKLLGKPDQLMPNPHHRRGPKMRLYARARVLQAEASPDFLSDAKLLSPALKMRHHP